MILYTEMFDTKREKTQIASQNGYKLSFKASFHLYYHVERFCPCLFVCMFVLMLNVPVKVFVFSAANNVT